mmetsp:Transcript_74341/g.140679  ORF Transcript_74341/g.140679 Transcript_74341/m.140679 type:complete len:318 (+) Transcript_74341:93-1046(+)
MRCTYVLCLIELLALNVPVASREDIDLKKLREQYAQDEDDDAMWDKPSKKKEKKANKGSGNGGDLPEGFDDPAKLKAMWEKANKDGGMGGMPGMPGMGGLGGSGEGLPPGVDLDKLLAGGYAPKEAKDSGSGTGLPAGMDANKLDALFDAKDSGSGKGLPPGMDLKNMMNGGGGGGMPPGMGGMGGGGAEMKSLTAYLKDGVCADKKCTDEVSRKFSSLLATGGVPELMMTAMDPWDQILYIFQGAALTKMTQVRGFLLEQSEVLFVTEDHKDHFPEGTLLTAEEIEAKKKKKGAAKKPATKQKKKKKKTIGASDDL